GENGLATVLALANADLNDPPAGEAVYFDLFARWMVRWKSGASSPLAIVVVVLLLVEIGMLWRRRAMRAVAFLMGLVDWIVMLAFSGAIGYALLFGLRAAGAMPPASAAYGWIAQPIIAVTAFVAL